MTNAIEFPCVCQFKHIPHQNEVTIYKYNNTSLYDYVDVKVYKSRLTNIHIQWANNWHIPQQLQQITLQNLEEEFNKYWEITEIVETAKNTKVARITEIKENTENRKLTEI